MLSDEAMGSVTEVILPRTQGLRGGKPRATLMWTAGAAGGGPCFLSSDGVLGSMRRLKKRIQHEAARLYTQLLGSARSYAEPNPTVSNSVQPCDTTAKRLHG